MKVEELTSIYFPNLELLSFLVVLALPKASMIGFVAKICSSTSVIPDDVVTYQKTQGSVMLL